MTSWYVTKFLLGCSFLLSLTIHNQNNFADAWSGYKHDKNNNRRTNICICTYIAVTTTTGIHLYTHTGKILVGNRFRHCKFYDKDYISIRTHNYRQSELCIYEFDQIEIGIMELKLLEQKL